MGGLLVAHDLYVINSTTWAALDFCSYSKDSRLNGAAGNKSVWDTTYEKQGRPLNIEYPNPSRANQVLTALSKPGWLARKQVLLGEDV